VRARYRPTGHTDRRGLFGLLRDPELDLRVLGGLLDLLARVPGRDVEALEHPHPGNLFPDGEPGERLLDRLGTADPALGRLDLRLELEPVGGAEEDVVPGARVVLPAVELAPLEPGLGLPLVIDTTTAAQRGRRQGRREQTHYRLHGTASSESMIRSGKVTVGR